MGLKAGRRTEPVDEILLVKLNGVGLSVRAIAAELGCSPAHVSMTLSKLNVPPGDTRRSLGTDLYKSLKPIEREWLANTLYAKETSLLAYMASLIQAECGRQLTRVAAKTAVTLEKSS